jgi:hypothetical protein
MGGNGLKEINIDDLLEKTFGKKPPKQVEVSLERLKPPPVVETSVDSVKAALGVRGSRETDSSRERFDSATTDSTTTDIDFTAIATSSEFKRFIYYLLVGKTHRGTKKQLDQDINTKIRDTRRAMDFKKVVEDIKKGVKLDPVGTYKYEPYQEK